MGSYSINLYQPSDDELAVAEKAIRRFHIQGHPRFTLVGTRYFVQDNFTVCVAAIITPDNLFAVNTDYVGVAKRSMRDNYNETIGKNVALTRAVRMALEMYEHSPKGLI